MLCLESRDKEGMLHCVFDVRMSENLTITQCFENKTKNLLSKQKQTFMSSQGRSRETRQTVKQRQAVWRSIKESMGDNEDPPAWAKELLTQVTSMKDTFQHKFDELSNSMKEIKKDTRAIVNRVGNAEKRIGSLEDKQVSQQLAIQDSAKEIKNLKAKVSYLESHSRRNNLIIVGLEEGLLETGDPAKDPGQELAAIFRYILDRRETDPAPEVDRHHRSLCPRPDPGEPPRPYIVRLLRWSDRQLILGAAAKKKKLSWKGKTFQVFQDLPADIQQRRAEYADIKKKLRGAGLRYGLLFPAMLIVTVGEEQ